jgi:hypothetical protein
MESLPLPLVIIAVVQWRTGVRQQVGEARLPLSQRQRAQVSSRCRRSKTKYTSPAALPVSDGAWIMPNEVMPSG